MNASYRYLEVRRNGCDTSQTVALDIIRRPKATPIHELERYMRCKDCSRLQSYPFKRSHLIACGYEDLCQRSGVEPVAGRTMSCRMNVSGGHVYNVVVMYLRGWGSPKFSNSVTFAPDAK